MAGLLTPQSSSMLIGALRKEFPEVPIHVHTHDTLGALPRIFASWAYARLPSMHSAPSSCHSINEPHHRVINTALAESILPRHRLCSRANLTLPHVPACRHGRRLHGRCREGRRGRGGLRHRRHERHHESAQHGGAGGVAAGHGARHGCVAAGNSWAIAKCVFEQLLPASSSCAPVPTLVCLRSCIIVRHVQAWTSSSSRA